MAVKGGRPKAASNECYGPGKQVRNPFFNGEEYEFNGPAKTIESPHGSAFEGAPVRSGNKMDEAIDRTPHAGGIKGKK